LWKFIFSVDEQFYIIFVGQRINNGSEQQYRQLQKKGISGEKHHQGMKGMEIIQKQNETKYKTTNTPVANKVDNFPFF